MPRWPQGSRFPLSLCPYAGGKGRGPAAAPLCLSARIRGDAAQGSEGAADTRVQVLLSDTGFRRPGPPARRDRPRARARGDNPRPCRAGEPGGAAGRPSDAALRGRAGPPGRLRDAPGPVRRGLEKPCHGRRPRSRARLARFIDPRRPPPSAVPSPARL